MFDEYLPDAQNFQLSRDEVAIAATRSVTFGRKGGTIFDCMRSAACSNYTALAYTRGQKTFYALHLASLERH